MAINRRSKNITEGVQRAPNRSMYYGMGYEADDFAKPMVGIANAHSTITPCNSGLQPLADAAEAGLKEALKEIPALRAEFHEDVNVTGSPGTFNQVLERAGRVSDFFEFSYHRLGHVDVK